MFIFTPPRQVRQSTRDRAMQTWYKQSGYTGMITLNHSWGNWTRNGLPGKIHYSVKLVAPPFKTVWSRLKWFLFG